MFLDETIKKAKVGPGSRITNTNNKTTSISPLRILASLALGLEFRGTNLENIMNFLSFTYSY